MQHGQHACSPGCFAMTSRWGVFTSVRLSGHITDVWAAGDYRSIACGRCALATSTHKQTRV